MSKVGRPPDKTSMLGLRFGRLLVLSHDSANRQRGQWVCQCDCGNTKSVAKSSLVDGHTQSCGCFQKEGVSRRASTHRMTGTPEHRSWSAMRTRCLNKNATGHERYADKPICERWNSFENFYADMGPRPAGTSLDRIDNSLGYSPENCRWATRKEQNNNTRANVVIEAFGRRMTLSMWAEEIGVLSSTLRRRISRMPYEQAIKESMRHGKQAS